MSTYRDQIVQAYVDEAKAYDKAVMTLAGGTLAISLTFIKDVIKEPRAGTVTLLACAWAALGYCIVAILASQLTSQWALLNTIKQIDKGQTTQLQSNPGGWLAMLTLGLNVTAALGFILGVIFLACFAIGNMGAIRAVTGP